MLLTNSPSRLTMWRLEARRSFSLGVTFVDSNGAGLPVTGCTATFVLAQPPWKGGAVLLTRELDLLDPDTGVCRLNLQAADLDLAAEEYPATITLLTSEGYSAAILSSVVEISDNPDASTTGVYDGFGFSTGITVKLGERQQLTVSVSNLPATGMSAYDLAVDGGFAGSLEEWVASLEGAKGDRGDPGYDGVLLLEANQTVADVPVGLPVGTIIFRKA